MPVYMNTGGRRIPAEEWAHALHRVCRCVRVDTSLPPGTAADRIIEQMKIGLSVIEERNRRIDARLGDLEKLSQQLTTAIGAPSAQPPAAPPHPSYPATPARVASPTTADVRHATPRKRVSARARHPLPRTE